MYRLWAPWRLKYITGDREKECIFCKKPRENKDNENFILLRGKKCFVMLNLFPYNNGHLMVAPYRHISSIEDMNFEEQKEMINLTSRMVILLRKVMHPEGFNIGMNLGKSAGAGIVDHIHLHIVPRWTGDSNFMPLLSETKVISEALEETYKKLKEKLEES